MLLRDLFLLFPGEVNAEEPPRDTEEWERNIPPAAAFSRSPSAPSAAPPAALMSASSSSSAGDAAQGLGWAIPARPGAT